MRDANGLRDGDGLVVTMEPTASTRLEVREGQGVVRFKVGGSPFVIIFMVVWLCFWAAGEAFAVARFLPGAAATKEPSLVTFVWLTLWTVGGVAAANSLLWMIFGEELVEANLIGLTHSRKVLGFRRARIFAAQNITKLSWVEQPVSEGRPSTMVSFDYGTRTIRILQGIDRAEADSALEVIRSALGKRRDA